jgi:hypothetical protein
MHRIGRFAWLAFVCPLLDLAQTASPTVPARMLVTVGHYYSHEPQMLRRDALIVAQQYEQLPITNLIPLRGAHAGLELFLLVDDCSNYDPGSKFEELSRFIVSQPSTTSVGIAHIQDGRLQVAENPTQDHRRAAEALSAPAGSKPASPFGALAELIRGWPHGTSRRAVLMISNGINPAAKDNLPDPSAEAALETAQRAGVTVYVIYHPDADYLLADSFGLYQGQLQLAHVAFETGGGAYSLGVGPLPSLAPFLDDMADHLANQYLLEFLANPGEGPGELREVTVKGKSPDVELMAPARVWIPGHRPGRPSDKGWDNEVSRGERP